MTRGEGMTDEPGTGPVADFCADLGELQRRSGRGLSSLSRELSISRGHLYTILQGNVKRPPDWSRVVEPFVRACGADREEVAQWRKRHDVLVQVVEQLRRERRRDDRGPGDQDTPSPPPAPPPRRSRRFRLVSAAVALVVVTGAAAGAGMWIARPPDDSSPCVNDAPPVPTDLMEVPHEHPDDGQKYNDWWPSNSRIEMGPYSLREFVATVRAGTAEQWNLIMLRSCLPLEAGRPYVLSFTAKADTDVTVRTRIQEPSPNTVYALTKDIQLSSEERKFSFPFVGASTTRRGEVQFQLGGQPTDFRISVTDVAVVG